MTQLTFDRWACRNTRAKLDAYIDDELLVETNLEMARHFAGCADCAREAGMRREIRARIKAAVRLSPVPGDLETRLRERLRQPARDRAPIWKLMGIAAAVVLCFGSWLAYERSMLGIGLADHVHCAVVRQGVLKPSGQDKLSAGYKPVLAIAREQVPAGMRLAVAHECTYQGRKFVHVTFRDDRRLLSVVVARRGDWERLPAGLHSGQIKGFQVAGIETHQYLVYTVSDLPRQENLRILSAMAPAIRIALNGAKG